MPLFHYPGGVSRLGSSTERDTASAHDRAFKHKSHLLFTENWSYPVHNPATRAAPTASEATQTDPDRSHRPNTSHRPWPSHRPHPGYGPPTPQTPNFPGGSPSPPPAKSR